MNWILTVSLVLPGGTTIPDIEADPFKDKASCERAGEIVVAGAMATAEKYGIRNAKVVPECNEVAK